MQNVIITLLHQIMHISDQIPYQIIGGRMYVYQVIMEMLLFEYTLSMAECFEIINE